MSKKIVSVLLAALFLLPLTGLPALADTGGMLNLSGTDAFAGRTITASGTFAPDTWIAVKVVDANGNILFFDEVRSDADGAYTCSFQVPNVPAGTLKVIAGYGSNVAEENLTVMESVSSTTPVTKASADNSGKVTAEVTRAQISDAIHEAMEKAETQGNSEAAIALIKAEAPATAKTIEVSLPKEAVDDAADSSIAALTVSTPVAAITFDNKALDTISGQAAGEVLISAEREDAGALGEEAKQTVGDRPVYHFSVTSGGKTISQFGGNVSVSVPYTPSPDEDINSVVIYFVSDDGELVLVPYCVYDASTGMVTFLTNHFSAYAVGYNDVSFTDVSGWYEDYVTYLAAREIINGTGGNQFSPDANITRAEFVVILARLSGADLSKYTTSSFSDVTTTDWYFAAVQWAYENGIAAGADGRFDPSANITREQIPAMLYRYAEYAGADVSNIEGMSIREFSDYEDISIWAMVSIQWAINNSIISGKDDGSFAPAASATRAQAAKMIALLLQGMIG